MGDCLYLLVIRSQVGDCLYLLAIGSQVGDCLYLLAIRSQVGDCPYLRTAGPVDAGVHQPLELLLHLVQGVRRAVQSVPQPDAGLTRPHHPRAARVHPALLGCTATRAAGVMGGWVGVQARVCVCE